MNLYKLQQGEKKRKKERKKEMPGAITIPLISQKRYQRDEFNDTKKCHQW